MNNNNSIRRNVAIGIISLFIILALTPVMQGYNIKTTVGTTEREVIDEHYAFDRFDKYHISELSNHEYELELLAISKETINPSQIETEKEETAPIRTADGLMDSPWPMKCHDLRHTGRSPYSTADITDLEKWRFFTDRPIEASPVIGADGTIYVGELGRYLYALYPDGTLKWKYKTNGWIWSAPAIDENGIVYIGTHWDYLYAINPDGTKKWVFDAGDTISSSPAIAEDGTIYFGTMGSGCNIFAVNPNGTEKWRYHTGYYIVSDPAIGEDGTIYIGSGDNYLYALYSNGTLKWRFKTGHEIHGHPSIADDGTIYFDSYDGKFYAVYPNGTLRWKLGISGPGCGSAAIGEDGIIYYGGDKFYAIYPDGTIKWSFDLGGASTGHSSPALSADGTIYINAGGSLIALNCDGTEKWHKTVKGDGSSPIIAEDGTVYVGAPFQEVVDGTSIPGGYIHAFGPVESNEPPEIPNIAGPINGEVRKTYYYEFKSHDPDRNPVRFYINWGDGEKEWSNEYASDQVGHVKHKYLKSGTYVIKAKAQDSLGAESDWGTLEVTMPVNKIVTNSLFLRFLGQFPLLEKLLFNNINFSLL
jgi:outer membrane protein assembly factor BamB